MDFFELLVHDGPVVRGLHVGVGRTAHQHQPVGAGVDGEGKVGLAEAHDGVEAAFGLLGGIDEPGLEAGEHVEAAGEEELLLVAVVVREQAEGNAGAFGDLLEGRLCVAAFAKELFGRLQKRRFLGRGVGVGHEVRLEGVEKTLFTQTAKKRQQLFDCAINHKGGAEVGGTLSGEVSGCL